MKGWFRRRAQEKSVRRRLGELLAVPLPEIEAAWRSFDRFYRMRRYAKTLGEAKTLDRLESFITYVLLAAQRPASITEVGTFYGKSTRRIIDMKAALGMDPPVTCYDISDNVTFFKPSEARLIVADITADPAAHLLEQPAPRFVFLDARPYQLLKNVVLACMEHLPETVLAIHDCSPALCRAQMSLDTSCVEVGSSTGIWERHVLAEIFGIADPLSPSLDDITTATHRFLIFDTQHGLAVLVPKPLPPSFSARVRQLAAGQPGPARRP